MSALEAQIANLDATLTDLAIGENQERFQLVTRRRDELGSRYIPTMGAVMVGAFAAS